MNEDDLDEWEDVFRYETTLKRTISLAGLIKRWAGRKIAGYELDLEGISQLVRQTDQLTAYALIRLIECSGSNTTCRVNNISYPEMKLITTKRGLHAVLFNLDDIEKFELNNFTGEEKISIWRNAMDSFTEKEKETARVIIGKFQGKSHTDICGEVFGENIADPPGKIKKMKNKAQTLADERGLPMPEWDSRNK